MAPWLAAASLAAAGCAKQKPGKNEPGPTLTAQQIVEKNAEARGGLDEWRKVETISWIGHVESAHGPAPTMPFRLDQKRPNKTRLEVDAPGDKSLRVFNGVRGWKLHIVHGQPQVQPYAPQEVKSAQASRGIEGPLLNHAAHGITASLQGVDEVGGRRTYHLVLHLPGNATEDVWVDQDNFLEVRYDRMVESPAGPRRVSVTYADYHSVEGLKLPFVVETGADQQGTTPDKMLLDQALINPPLPDSTFENPGEHRSMARRQAGLPGEAAQRR